MTRALVDGPLAALSERVPLVVELRRYATLALAWPSHPGTTAVLRDRAGHDTDAETRAAAEHLLEQPAS